MRPRDVLLAALPALVLGVGAGFWLATSLDRAPSVLASPPEVLDAAAPAAPAERAGPAAAEVAPVAEVAGARAPAPAAEPERPSVSAERLERAVAAVAAPAVAAARGAGAITGEVLDTAGAPLAGVVVMARPTGGRDGDDPTRVGAGPPEDEDLEEALRRQAESWAEGRAQRRTAVTGADGRFEVAGLDASELYSVSAYLEGHVLSAERSSWVSPGSEVAFTAEPVHQIPVRLVRADGTSPAGATIGVRRGDRDTYWTWTPEAPYLRLAPGRVRVRAYAGDEQRMQRELFSLEASEEQSLDVAAQGGAPLELVLLPRRGIRGRVVAGSATTGGSRVRVLPLPEGAELDAEALARSDRQTWLLGDRFAFLDLEPGRWAVGLGGWRDTLVAHEVVTVADGIVELELVVPEPDADEHIALRAWAPDGTPLRDLEFRWERRSGHGSSSGGIQGRRDRDGTWWLRPEADYLEPWPDETSYTLTVRHADLGERKVELAEGQREVEVAYEEPASLTVVVAGYVGSGYEGRVTVQVAQVSEDGPAELVGRNTIFGPSRDAEGQLSAEGVARWDRLAPGEWEVRLATRTERYSARTIASTRVRLTAGEREVQIDMPALYELVVVAPELPAQSWMRLQSADGGESALHYGETARTDADGRAVFTGLVAGAYTLSGTGLREPVEVSVPRGELFLDAREPDCLRVAIGDMEGALYTAGLRAGDLVIGADGAEFTSAPRSWDLLRGEGSVTLIVLRDGERLEVVLPRPPSGTRSMAALGGMLTPANR